jgi:hypothetical protein
MPAGVGCHRASTQAGYPMQPGFQPVHAWTLTGLSSLALELREPPPAVASAKQLACPAIVLLLGMPGRPAVTSSGRSGYGAPAEAHVLPRNPQVELVPLPPAPASGRRWPIPPRR